ncbi:MAG: hypothetical protein AB1898_29955 [Acidobacteriota bacterium]
MKIHRIPVNPASRREFLIGLAGLVSVGRGLEAQEGHPSTVDDDIRKLASEAPLSLKFEGETAEQCRQWQARFSDRLRSALGPFAPPHAWETVSRQCAEFDDHRREELLLQADGFPPLPVYLLTPKGKESPRPGILALHGHGAYGHHTVAGRDDLPGVAEAIQEANYDYGRQLVRRGYVVAVPCFTPFGQRRDETVDYGGEDHCAVTFVRMMLLGKVLMAENLRDALWALEMLVRDRRVDSQRLAGVGLSYGGRMTMLTAALEPRIRAAVVSGALNVMQERIQAPYSCGAQVIPGLLQYGDTPEIASLIAPRRCLWEIGSQDRLIPEPWASQALSRIRNAYRAYSAESALQVDRFEGGHRWNGRIAYPFLERVLS